MEVTQPQYWAPSTVSHHQLPSKTLSAPVSPPPSSSTSKRPRLLPPHENVNNNALDVDYFDFFPPGYRFCPKDEELIVYYLRNKVNNQPLPRNKIVDVNLYKYNPRDLAEAYRKYGENEWYFFTPREKKYQNGSRPKRAAGNGYWKATGADRPVKHNDVVVGYRKALVFYSGDPKRSTKTNWIMHEYRVSDAPSRIRRSADDKKLDDWVLCRIYKRTEKSIVSVHTNEEPALLDDGDVDVNVEHEGDSQGYTNTVADYEQPNPISIPLQEFEDIFSDLPPLEDLTNFKSYVHQQPILEADSYCSYGTSMVEPAFEIHPIEDFTTKYLNENDCGLKSIPLPDDRKRYIPDQFCMVSLENIVCINSQNNLLNQSSSK
ncbi:hypothetical protein P3X46_030376 [Hevea brasiliensis]|uniref:NAC domain-containing protein n=1 Tax=Hevea brasiliensis TaxID=3981 RepID=A0ABQ9KJX0_HEVBR|nr:hypothetical protein P3X46_030376 [Hevea brasiliensis]